MEIETSGTKSVIFDCHVHMGYYARVGHVEPFYYSPRRIMGVLNRCGVDEFIVSSTCAQVEGIKIKDVVREAREMKRLAGGRANIFFWLSGCMYDEDPTMAWFQTGLFEGIKLHECETPWLQKRRRDLEKILSFAEMHGLPVMFHAGTTGWCRPPKLADVARKHPTIRFNFAHCRPMDEMANVIAKCPNVWTDTAYMAPDEFVMLHDFDWHGRLMFGTDLPVWQAREDISLTKKYREYVRDFKSLEMSKPSYVAFRRFLEGHVETQWYPSKS